MGGCWLFSHSLVHTNNLWASFGYENLLKPTEWATESPSTYRLPNWEHLCWSQHHPGGKRLPGKNTGCRNAIQYSVLQHNYILNGGCQRALCAIYVRVQFRHTRRRCTNMGCALQAVSQAEAGIMLCLQGRQFQHSSGQCCWEFLFFSFGRVFPLRFFSNIVKCWTPPHTHLSFFLFCNSSYDIYNSSLQGPFISFLPILCGPFFAMANFHQDVSVQFLLFSWCLKSSISIQQAGNSMFIVNRAPEMLAAILREGK